MLSPKLRFHLARIRHELGQPLMLGGRRFRARGYLSNNFALGSKHELHLLEPLRRAMALKPGPVIDVGVNAGQTLLKLLSIDPSRAYVGFEPQVDCCFFVEKFLRDNGLQHQIICLALSNENRVRPFYSSSSVDVFGSLIITSPEHHKNARFVPVRVGDEVLEEIGMLTPAVIKVDVEGAEVQVFNGLRKTISRARPVCFFEVLPMANSSDELLRFFSDLNYQIRQIKFDGSEHVVEVFDRNSCDYVAYPNVP